jgi:dipeptidyl aminopeptidase/acylaminoacyl peptidase
LLTQLSGGGWRPLDWSSDDKNILLLEEVSSSESHLWLVETTKGQKTAVTPGKPGMGASYKDAKFGKDAKSIFVTTNKDSEFYRLAQLELATGDLKYLDSEHSEDVEEFALSQDGTRIAYVTNADGTNKLHALDLDSQKELVLPALPEGVIRGIRWHKNGQDLAFTLSTARTPADCYSVNTRTGEVEQWTLSESALKTNAFSLPEVVRWKSFDGRMISGILYRPPAKFWGKRPVLVVIHDGPEGQSQSEFIGQNNYFLNELGIALLYANVRGSTGYGKTFSQLDDGFQRENSYKDIGSLLDWIANRPDLDADHIAIAGTGYGGQMALTISGLYGDRIRCVIDVAGASNLATFLDKAQGYRRNLLHAKFGGERDQKMREFLEKIAPINNVAKIKKPVLIIAGQNDPLVALSESERMAAALKEHGTVVWYLMAKDEGHGFQKKANLDFQFYSSILFLEENLLK